MSIDSTGARADRVRLTRAIAQLGRDDMLLVTRLDRSTRELLNILARVTEAGACFKSLDETWADTTTPRGRLMVTMIGGIGEFERQLIRARTGGERASARPARSSAASRSSLTTRGERRSRTARVGRSRCSRLRQASTSADKRLLGFKRQDDR